MYTLDEDTLHARNYAVTVARVSTSASAPLASSRTSAQSTRACQGSPDGIEESVEEVAFGACEMEILASAIQGRKHWAFAAAGAYGFSYVGVVSALHRLSVEYLKCTSWGAFVDEHVEGCSGCSAGSLVATAVVCGVDPGRIADFIEHADVSGMLVDDIRMIAPASKQAMDSFLDQFMQLLSQSKSNARFSLALKATNLPSGLLPGKFLTSLARCALQSWVCDADITFAQLFQKTRRKLFIVATDLTWCQPFVFSHVHTPDMPVYIGIRASASVPGVFMPVHMRDENVVLVDGGVVDSCAIGMSAPGNTLCFRIGVETDFELTPTSLLTRVMNTATHSQCRLVHDAISSARHDLRPAVITMEPADFVNSTGYAMSAQERKKCGSQGQRALRVWLHCVQFIRGALMCLALARTHAMMEIERRG